MTDWLPTEDTIDGLTLRALYAEGRSYSRLQVEKRKNGDVWAYLLMANHDRFPSHPMEPYDLFPGDDRWSYRIIESSLFFSWTPAQWWCHDHDALVNRYVSWN